MPNVADAWTPDLRKRPKPLYRALADAIADDVRSGRLAAGDRLPSQRALSQRLELDFTTVARGYVEAARRGLIASHVGQGSFVLGAATAAPAERRTGIVDLSMNLPPEPDDPALVARMQEGLAAVGRDLVALLRYQGFGGAPEDREAGVRWLARRGLRVPAERLLATPGTHAALLALFGTLAKPGDAIACEDVTYPGARAVAAQLGLKLVGLPMDRDGVEPDAFAEACLRHAPKALYLNPTMLNPTTLTIPERRRLTIASVARRHKVAIVEDDAYGMIPRNGPQAFAALAPDVTWHVSGLAKCLGAGLRLAYLVAPETRATWPLASALRTATVMASPLTTALATRWIMDGTADAILDWVREESRARQALAAELLPRGCYQADPEGFHLWVALPPPWRRANFADHMRASGVGVVVADAFAVRDPAPEAVRVCLGGAATRAEVRNALDFMAHALEETPAMASAIL